MDSGNGGCWPATRFRVLPRTTAVATLAATLALALGLVLVALAYVDPPPAHAGDGDLALYGRIVARLHAGEPYYTAAHAELIAGHYDMLSVANWRTPLYPWLLSRLPSVDVAQAGLMLLALIPGAAGVLLTLREANRTVAIIAGALFLVTLSGTIAPGTVLYSEYASGLLILFSASAYGLGWRGSGIVAGAAALFVRELAAPYVLVSLVLAWREKRWREVAMWLAVITAYAAFYAWHYAMVHALLGPTDMAHPSGWLRFGGASFMLSAASFNGVLTAAPMWVSALLLPLAVLGLLAWPSRADIRIVSTVFAYLLAFAFVGKPLNRYWGEMCTPLLTFGLAWALPALDDLARAVTATHRVRGAPRFRVPACRGRCR